MSHLETDLAHLSHQVRTVELRQHRQASRAAAVRRLQRRAARLSGRAERVARRADKAAGRARLALARAL
jgi:hypothetical protein